MGEIVPYPGVEEATTVSTSTLDLAEDVVPVRSTSIDLTAKPFEAAQSTPMAVAVAAGVLAPPEVELGRDGAESTAGTTNTGGGGGGRGRRGGRGARSDSDQGGQTTSA